MDWAASAIKPGRRSLNLTSMDGRRARDAIKDPSGTKSDAMCLVDRRHTYSLYTFYFIFTVYFACKVALWEHADVPLSLKCTPFLEARGCTPIPEVYPPPQAVPPPLEQERHRLH